MHKDHIIDAILFEMERVWGPEGFGGEIAEYEWLLANFNITEEEDVRWQLVLQQHMDDLPEEDREDPEVIQFLQNDTLVDKVLAAVLTKYRSNSATYPR
jgi:hypothetical protein